MVNAVAGLGPEPAQKPARTMADMSPENFLKLLVTQLQFQDPTEPVKNQDVLNQISAIRQLQSNLDLSKSVTTTGKQQQIVSAGALIGKHVEGLNSQADPVAGIVTSITVQKDTISLELDNGQQVAINNVTKVAPADAGAPATTGQ